jgi:hypothetical protein
MAPLHTTTLDNAMDLVAQRLTRPSSEGIRPVCCLPGNAGRVDAVEIWTFGQPPRLRGVDQCSATASATPPGSSRAFAPMHSWLSGSF